jgi:predicted membrane chloride channel (bestrophin family)
MARAHEYAHALGSHFERLRNARHYRTPASLRSYAKLFLNIMPLLFAPHFAHLATLHAPFVGYVVAGVYGVILVSLDNIQDALENPFDAVGEDDIVLDAVSDYHRITATRVTQEREHATALLARE